MLKKISFRNIFKNEDAPDVNMNVSIISDMRETADLMSAFSPDEECEKRNEYRTNVFNRCASSEFTGPSQTQDLKAFIRLRDQSNP